MKRLRVAGMGFAIVCAMGSAFYLGRSSTLRVASPIADPSAFPSDDASMSFADRIDAANRDPEFATHPAGYDDGTPAHRYSQKIDDVYYYTAAASGNSAAHEVFAFKYLGKGRYGGEVIAQMRGELPVDTAFCRVPCAIIQFGSGRNMAFDTDTVVGSAMDDAINGRLQQTTLYKPYKSEQIPPVQRTNSAPTPPAYPEHHPLYAPGVTPPPGYVDPDAPKPDTTADP